MKYIVRPVFLLCVLAIVSSQALAVLVPLTDQNASAQIETGLDIGQFSWEVDKVNSLNQQWFWYRVGDIDPEAPINSLIEVGAFATDTNPFTDPSIDTLAVLYRQPNNLFEIEASFTLRGGTAGSATSDIAETISIRNLTDAELDFHFFQYVDIDLSPDGTSDTVVYPNVNTVQQTFGSVSVSETVITPVASHREANLFPITLDALQDGVATTLNDNLGPVVGDTTWAFQWDLAIAPRGSLLISKDKQLIVPEPTCLLLLGLGSLLLGRSKRKVC